MFGKKLLNDIKETLDNLYLKFKDLTVNVEKNNNEIIALKKHFTEEIDNLKDQFLQNTFELSKELKNINEQSGRFKRCINTFENLKNNLDDILTKKITSMAEFEIKKVKESLSGLNNVEKDFKALIFELNNLKDEIKKFNTISKGIKEVDFTLNKHIREIEQISRKKIELEHENEKLKSMMAKMKRNRHL